MKNLTLKHVMMASKIIKAANLKEQATELLSKAGEKGANSKEIGVQAAMIVVDAIANNEVEQKVYALLDDVFETKSEDMSLEALASNFKELAKKNNLSSFFKSAGKLTQ